MKLSRREWLQYGGTGAALLGSSLRNFEANRQTETAMPQDALAGRLGFNENPDGPPEGAREVLLRSVGLANRYAAPGVLVTADVVCEKIAARERLKPEQVVLGHGSWELLWRIAAVFGRDISAAITADPTFFGLPNAIKLLERPLIQVPVNARGRFDLAAIGEWAEQPQHRGSGKALPLMYLCQPNNPTGTIVSGTELRAFCTRFAERALLVVDEAYLEYVEPSKDASAIALVRDGAPIIVLRTFSKIWGMAALRVGYALTSATLARRLGAWDPGPINPLSLAAVAAAYDDEAFVLESRSRNQRAMKTLREGLARLELRAPESAANFAFVHLGPEAALTVQRLATVGLHFMSVAGYPQHIRISAGRPADAARVIDALQRLRRGTSSTPAELLPPAAVGSGGDAIANRIESHKRSVASGTRWHPDPDGPRKSET